MTISSTIAFLKKRKEANKEALFTVTNFLFVCLLMFIIIHLFRNDSINKKKLSEIIAEFSTLYIHGGWVMIAFYLCFIFWR